jgi:hypothetical protein
MDNVHGIEMASKNHKVLCRFRKIERMGMFLESNSRCGESNHERFDARINKTLLIEMTTCGWHGFLICSQWPPERDFH